MDADIIDSIRAATTSSLLLTVNSMLMACVTGVLRVASALAVGLFVYRRTYFDISSSRTEYNNALVFLDRHKLFASGRRTDQSGRLVLDGAVVGVAFFARVEHARELCKNSFFPAVTVWRWRWLAPILTDAIKKTRPPSEITVVRRHLDGWSASSERACPPAVPADVRRECRANATRIVEALALEGEEPEGEGEDRVSVYSGQARVLISGPPGCGKSTCGRVVAQALREAGRDVVLVVGFDPTKPGQSAGGAIQEARNRMNSPNSGWTVVVIDEVDGIVRKIAQAEAARRGVDG